MDYNSDGCAESASKLWLLVNHNIQYKPLPWCQHHRVQEASDPPSFCDVQAEHHTATLSCSVTRWQHWLIYNTNQ